MKQGGEREWRREDETEGRREGEQLGIKRPGEKEEGVFNRLKPVKNTKSGVCLSPSSLFLNSKLIKSLSQSQLEGT